MLLSSLGTSIANVALPTLAQAFEASFQAVQWVILAYLLGITILIVSVGRLGDILGRRRLLLAGIVLFTAAGAVCGVAPELWVLLGARAAQGLGAAVMMALTMALVDETVPKSKTGSAMGVLATMAATGTALGPSLGGVLIAGPGWRTIFLVTVPLGVLAFVLARRTLPADLPEATTGQVGFDKGGFDNAGTLLLALTLAAYALAMTLGRGRFGAFNITLLAAAGYGLFQTANNTAVMSDVPPDRRGVVSGMLNLSRNLGLITGASVMGAVFAFASATSDITTARPEAVAAGMRTTFAVAAALMVAALAIAFASRALARSLSSRRDA